jgi:hypothetical protein
MAISGVALPQGIEGWGMAGLGETLRSHWPPLAMCWHAQLVDRYRLVDSQISLTSQNTFPQKFQLKQTNGFRVMAF